MLRYDQQNLPGHSFRASIEEEPSIYVEGCPTVNERLDVTCMIDMAMCYWIKGWVYSYIDIQIAWLDSAIVPLGQLGSDAEASVSVDWGDIIDV